MEKMFESMRSLEQDDRGVLLRFLRPVLLLSSSVVGGGWQEIESFLNLKVPPNPVINPRTQSYPSPAETVAEEAARLGLKEPLAAMMTAASMDSFRRAERRLGTLSIEALVTSGLSNARRVGDTADQALAIGSGGPPGTINILVGTNARLTPAAMAEALGLIGETKAAVMVDLAYPSPVSGRPATGTGTDSAGIYCERGADVEDSVAFCGKHTLFGENLAGVVADALEASLAWYKKKTACGLQAVPDGRS